MTADVRWKQRFDNFDRAVVLLREPFEADVSRLSALAREGTTRRLASAVELAWKTLKDYLEQEGQSIRPVTPRNVFEEAFAARILRDGQVWIDMLDHRNLLAHSYDRVTFDQAVLAIRDRYLAAIEDLHDWFLSRRST